MRRLLLTVVMFAVLAGSVFVSVTGPKQVLRDLGWRKPPCSAFTAIDLMAAPDIAGTLTTALQPLQKARVDEDGSCLKVTVTAQEPAQTLAGATVLPRDRWPHLWVPDSTLWLHRAEVLRTQNVAVIATTPMVVAGSSGRAAALRWTEKRPTWAQALDGVDKVALPDLTNDTTSLLALLAAKGSDPDGADERVARIAVAAQRTGISDTADAFDLAVTGAETAPVVPTTEQAVFAHNRGSAASGLLAVSPSDGVPVLDYTLTEINPTERSVPERQAMRMVESTLTSPDTAKMLRQAGFRDGERRSDGTTPVKALPLPSEEMLRQVAARVASLTSPAHLLAVIDVSTSMQVVTGGRSRIEIVRSAAAAAVSTMRSNDQVGLWVFASNLTPTSDHRVLADVARLSARTDAGTHRDDLVRQVNGLPRMLKPGGTSLYDTALKAVEEVTRHYEPLATNVVVLLTDGKNEDSQGLKLPLVVEKVRQIGKSARPVRVIAVGIGEDADMRALTAIATATPDLAAVSEEQAASSEEIASSVQDVSTKVAQGAQGAADVRNRMDEVSRAAGRVASSAEDLSRLASDLRALVGAFRLEEGAALGPGRGDRPAALAAGPSGGRNPR
jgi:hypothetical protein